MKYLIVFSIIFSSALSFSQTKYELTYNTLKSYDATGDVDSLSMNSTIVVNFNSNGDLKVIREDGAEIIFIATGSIFREIEDGHSYSKFNAVDGDGDELTVVIFDSDLGTYLHYSSLNEGICFYNKFNVDTLFYDNGKVLRVTNYDKLIETNYFENGEIESIGAIVQSEIDESFFRKHGDWKFYYNNGQIKERGLIELGQYDGEWYEYYENGNKKSIKNYLGRSGFGKKDQIGEEKLYNSNGSLKEVNEYGAMGLLEWEIYESNELIKKGKISYEGERITTWEKPEIFHVNFRNGCSQLINVLIYSENLDGEWETDAWYVIEPGEIAFVQKTKNSSVYYHAHSKDNNLIWGGTDIYKMEGDENYGLKKWSFYDLNIQKQTKKLTCP